MSSPCGRSARWPGLPGGVGAEPAVLDSGGPGWQGLLSGHPHPGVHCGSVLHHPSAVPCRRTASLSPQAGAGTRGAARCLPEGAGSPAGRAAWSRRLWSLGPASLCRRSAPLCVPSVNGHCSVTPPGALSLQNAAQSQPQTCGVQHQAASPAVGGSVGGGVTATQGVTCGLGTKQDCPSSKAGSRASLGTEAFVI